MLWNIKPELKLSSQGEKEHVEVWLFHLLCNWFLETFVGVTQAELHYQILYSYKANLITYFSQHASHPIRESTITPQYLFLSTWKLSN
jgi:hypothetical protein